MSMAHLNDKQPLNRIAQLAEQVLQGTIDTIMIDESAVDRTIRNVDTHDIRAYHLRRAQTMKSIHLPHACAEQLTARTYGPQRRSPSEEIPKY